MYLAEIIKEKDYIKKSIDDLMNHILDLSVVLDENEEEVNRSIIYKRFKSLEDLYTKYKQFSVSINRTESKVAIKVKDIDLALVDAVAIKGIMENKLEALEELRIKSLRNFREGKGILCLDIDKLFEEIKSTRLDIKTLESEIEFAMWQVEAK